MQRDNQAVDLELIRRVRAGEEGAESLVLKYIPMVKYIIRNYYSSFLDFEDLVQEGLIGLLSAIEEYKPERYDEVQLLCLSVHHQAGVQRHQTVHRKQARLLTKPPAADPVGQR